MSKKQVVEKIINLKDAVASLNTVSKQHDEAKEMLKESEERFRFLFDTAPIGLSISNYEGDILNANETLQKFLGYSMEELSNMNFLDFYMNKEDRKELLDRLEEKEHVRDFETVFRNKSGSAWNVLINSDYIELDNEKVLLTSINDLTSLKEIQAELLQSEKKYHAVFTNAPISMIVTDKSGNIVASNHAALKLFGCEGEELQSKNLTDFYSDKSKLNELVETTEKEGIVRNVETEFTDMNGRKFTALINADFIELDDSKVMLLTSIRDISYRKEMEEALKKERDYITAIVETTDSLLIVMDSSGKIVDTNLACQKTIGYSAEDLKGGYLWDFQVDDKKSVIDKIGLILSGDCPHIHEVAWKTKEGKERLISWSSTVLPGVVGDEGYIISTGTDITESRRAKQELELANIKLAEWIKELEERSQEMKQLSEMGGQLQLCQTSQEVCAISAQYIKMICKKSRGAIYLINPSKDLAEAVEMWGEDVYSEKIFLPSKCWATRKSRLHRIDPSHPGLKCEHITGPDSGQYICIPMMAQGELLGILHLNQDSPNVGPTETKDILYNNHKIQLISNVAEHISLALTNLKLRETLRQQSIRDLLTGLYNRRYMEETLGRELERAKRDQTHIGVIMLDIDHFKQFNDLSGHDAGDALLKELGSLLTSSFRGGDIACRYGGEEFFIVLPGASLQNAVDRAEALRKSVKEMMVYHLGRPLGKCTISLGVAAYPQNGSTIEQLIKTSDSALYQAKESGRDRVVISGE